MENMKNFLFGLFDSSPLRENREVYEKPTPRSPYEVEESFEETHVGFMTDDLAVLEHLGDSERLYAAGDITVEINEDGESLSIRFAEALFGQNSWGDLTPEEQNDILNIILKLNEIGQTEAVKKALGRVFETYSVSVGDTVCVDFQDNSVTINGEGPFTLSKDRVAIKEAAKAAVGIKQEIFERAVDSHSIMRVCQVLGLNATLRGRKKFLEEHDDAREFIDNALSDPEWLEENRYKVDGTYKKVGDGSGYSGEGYQNRAFIDYFVASESVKRLDDLKDIEAEFEDIEDAERRDDEEDEGEELRSKSLIDDEEPGERAEESPDTIINHEKQLQLVRNSILELGLDPMDYELEYQTEFDEEELKSYKFGTPEVTTMSPLYGAVNIKYKGREIGSLFIYTGEEDDLIYVSHKKAPGYGARSSIKRPATSAGDIELQDGYSVDNLDQALLFFAHFRRRARAGAVDIDALADRAADKTPAEPHLSERQQKKLARRVELAGGALDDLNSRRTEMASPLRYYEVETTEEGSLVFTLSESGKRYMVRAEPVGKKKVRYEVYDLSSTELDPYVTNNTSDIEFYLSQRVLDAQANRGTDLQERIDLIISDQYGLMVEQALLNRAFNKLFDGFETSEEFKKREAGGYVIEIKTHAGRKSAEIIVYENGTYEVSDRNNHEVVSRNTASRIDADTLVEWFNNYSSPERFGMDKDSIAEGMVEALNGDVFAGVGDAKITTRGERYIIIVPSSTDANNILATLSVDFENNLITLADSEGELNEGLESFAQARNLIESDPARFGLEAPAEEVDMVFDTVDETGGATELVTEASDKDADEGAEDESGFDAEKAVGDIHDPIAEMVAEVPGLTVKKTDGGAVNIVEVFGTEGTGEDVVEKLTDTNFRVEISKTKSLYTLQRFDMEEMNYVDVPQCTHVENPKQVLFHLRENGADFGFEQTTE